MVMVTAMAMTRERERGTLENLLAMPSHPLEVMLGKIIPFILMYMSGRFYKFLRKTISDLRRWR
jgi:ABC-type Na+ efflux pump permease subunit